MGDVNQNPMEGSANKETNRRDTLGFWRQWIISAKKRAEEHWRIARQAWSEYEAAGDSDSYPIYWSSCKTIEPAYYSRTPQLTNKRRLDINDDMAGTACLINKRLGDFLVENSNFDSVMMAVVGDYLHADKTAPQVVYEAETQDVPLFLDEMGQFTLEDGTPFTLQPKEIDGQFFGTQAIPETQKIFLSPVRYDEVLHTPNAKMQSDIREMAFWFVMTRDEAEKRFDAKVCQGITWKKGEGEKDERKKYERVQTNEEFLEGWEIYDKVLKNVKWYSEQYKEDFLDIKDDPYGLKDFFPCPAFIIGSKPSRHMYPVPVFKRLRRHIDTLSKQQDKIFDLIDAIDPRALIDGSNRDLLELTQEGSGRFIAIQNLQSLLEKGNLSTLVQFLPVKEMVDALSTFMQAEDSFKNSFYEHLGLPDILRGVSDQVSTATEQTLSASAGHDRFKFQKKQVKQVARDSIELMLDLAYKVFSDEKIAKIVGYEYMEEGDKQRFSDALNTILRDDEARIVRIDIETDSMSFIDEQLRAQQTNQAVTTFIQGLKSVSQTAKEDLPLARASLQALLESLESLGAPGQAFLETAKKTLEDLIQKAEIAAQNPQTQPPIEERKLQQEFEAKQAELALEGRKVAIEERKEIVNEQLEQVKTNFQQQLDSALLRLKEVSEQFSEFERSQLLKLEEYKVTLDEREKFIEEQRLAYEQQIEQIRVQLEQAKPLQAQAPQAPPVSINIDASKTTPVMPVIGGL